MVLEHQVDQRSETHSNFTFLDHTETFNFFLFLPDIYWYPENHSHVTAGMLKTTVNGSWLPSSQSDWIVST